MSLRNFSIAIVCLAASLACNTRSLAQDTDGGCSSVRVRQVMDASIAGRDAPNEARTIDDLLFRRMTSRVDRLASGPPVSYRVDGNEAYVELRGRSCEQAVEYVSDELAGGVTITLEGGGRSLPVAFDNVEALNRMQDGKIEIRLATGAAAALQHMSREQIGSQISVRYGDADVVQKIRVLQEIESGRLALDGAVAPIDLESESDLAFALEVLGCSNRCDAE